MALAWSRGGRLSYCVHPQNMRDLQWAWKSPLRGSRILSDCCTHTHTPLFSFFAYPEGVRLRPSEIDLLIQNASFSTRTARGAGAVA